MAGVKKQKGVQIPITRYFADGEEWVPCKVVAPKIMSRGYKAFMSAQSKKTGNLYLNAQGRPMPWKHIPFTTIEPEENS